MARASALNGAQQDDGSRCSKYLHIGTIRLSGVTHDHTIPITS